MKRFFFFLIGFFLFLWLVFFLVGKIKESTLYQSLLSQSSPISEKVLQNSSPEGASSRKTSGDIPSEQQKKDISPSKKASENLRDKKENTLFQQRGEDIASSASVRGVRALFFLLERDGVLFPKHTEIGTLQNIQQLLVLLSRDDLSPQEKQALQKALADSEEEAKNLFARLSEEENNLSSEISAEEKDLSRLQSDFLDALNALDEPRSDALFLEYQKKRGALCEKKAQRERLQKLKSRLASLARSTKQKSQQFFSGEKASSACPPLAPSVSSVSPSVSLSFSQKLPSGGYILGESTPIPRKQSPSSVSSGGQLLLLPQIEDRGNNFVYMEGVPPASSLALQRILHNDWKE